MNGFSRKSVVCHTVESEQAGTQQKSGYLKGKYDAQQIETQKGRMAKELRSAVTLMVQCQLATKDLIDTSDTYVADLLGEFLHSIEVHKDAMVKLQEVYK